MVGVGEGVVDDVPCLLVRKLLLVNQNSEKFDGADGGVGIVKLNFVEFGELSPVSVRLFESADDVMQRGSTEEILLLQSELLTLLTRVIRVEATCNVLGRLTLTNSTEVVTLVELVEVKFIAGARAP
jgi:hypothetical protein